MPIFKEKAHQNFYPEGLRHITRIQRNLARADICLYTATFREWIWLTFSSRFAGLQTKGENALLKLRTKFRCFINFGLSLHQFTFRPISRSRSRVLDVVVIATSIKTKFCRRTVIRKDFRFAVTEVCSESKTLTKSYRKNAPALLKLGE